MNIDKKWLKVVALALGFPNLILGSAWLFMSLVKEGLLPRWLGVLLFFLVVGNTLFLLVRFGFKKNKEQDPQ